MSSLFLQNFDPQVDKPTRAEKEGDEEKVEENGDAEKVTPVLQRGLRAELAKAAKKGNHGRKGKKLQRIGSRRSFLRGNSKAALKRRGHLKKTPDKSSKRASRMRDTPASSSDKFEMDESEEPEAEALPGYEAKAKKAKAESKGKAMPKAKAKSKAKALPKAKAKSKAKAKPKAKTSKKDVAKAKATPEAKSKTKRRAACAEDDEEPKDVKTKATKGEVHGHPRQRRVKAGDGSKKWWFEILSSQYYGCPSCRFIFNGCPTCKVPGYRGRRATEFWYSDQYQSALALLDADDEAWEEAEDEQNEEDFEVPEDDEVKKIPTRRLRSKQ